MPLRPSLAMVAGGILFATHVWASPYRLSTGPVFGRVADAPGALPLRLEVKAAPGEFEPVRLVVEADADIAALRVVPEDLKLAGGGVVAATDIRVQQLIGARTTLSGGRQVVVPEWLVPAEGPVSLGAPARRLDLWITVHVPPDARPGRYEGALSVLVEGEKARRVPLGLVVHPLARARPKTVFAALYTYEFRYLERFDPEFVPADKRRSAADLPAFLERGRAVVRDMAEHGMTAIFPHSSRDLLRKAGRLVFPDLEASLRAAREAGMTDMPGFFVGNLVNAQFADVPSFDPTRDPAALKEIAARAAAIAREAGFPSLILVPSDEPNDPDGRKRPVARKLLGAANGLPGVTLGVTSGSRVYDAPLELAGLHQVSIFEGFAPPERWDEMRRLGHPVWIYQNETVEGHSPLWSRFVFGFWGWRSGLDGITAWTWPTYTFAPYYERPRQDAEGRAVPEFDDRGRPINTLEWEAVREGVGDRRYLDTLVDLIARARAAGLSEPVAAAEGLLADLRAELPADLSTYRRNEMGDPLPDKLTAAWFDATRQRVVAASLKLSSEIQKRR